MTLHTQSELRLYQHKITDFMESHPMAAVFVDMSLGKTISTLTLIQRLFRSGELQPGDAVLVIAPLRVARTVWHKEAADWDHTASLRVSRILGSVKQRVAAIKAHADVYVMNVENVQWFFNKAVPQYVKKYGKFPWKVLVLDESSKFKHSNTERFKAIRHKLKFFKRRYLLTGTPRTKTLLNLWSQIYILDEGARLGTSFGRFKERFFMSTDFERRSWEPRDGADAYVQNLIRDITIRMDADDWLQLPPVVMTSVWVDLEPAERAVYDEFEREMFVKLDDTKDLIVFNAATVSGKCHQMANGAVYFDPDRRTDYHVIHDLKLDALDEVLAECMGNVMIAYNFKHDLERIRKRFGPIPTLKDDTEHMVAEWNAGRIKHLAVHPQSVAHGLNLQFGGNTIVFFSETWSAENFLQLVFRLRRPGQQADHISLIFILTRDTVDEAILASNTAGVQSERAFLDALNRYRMIKELLS